jgi:transposase
MKITTIGVDLAKEVFQIHGVNAHGKAVLRNQLRRIEMAKFFANLDPCLVGMEACGSAHYFMADAPLYFSGLYCTTTLAL